MPVAQLADTHSTLHPSYPLELDKMPMPQAFRTLSLVAAIVALLSFVTTSNGQEIDLSACKGTPPAQEVEAESKLLAYKLVCPKQYEGEVELYYQSKSTGGVSIIRVRYNANRDPVVVEVSTGENFHDVIVRFRLNTEYFSSNKDKRNAGLNLSCQILTKAIDYPYRNFCFKDESYKSLEARRYQAYLESNKSELIAAGVYDQRQD